jgi:hypothetical protein
MKVADQSLAMIGGKGWGNDDFLSSLGGSDEEKQEAKEKYFPPKNLFPTRCCNSFRFLFRGS